MSDIPSKAWNLFEAALVKVESPFTLGDIIGIVGDQFDDLEIITGLQALTNSGALQAVDGAKFAFSNSMEFDPGVINAAIRYIKTISEHAD